MPTPEEIKKISRAFAEQTSNGDALDPHIDFAEAFAAEVLQWLSRDYCIVPKSELRKVQKEVNRSFKDGDKISESEWERVFNWLFGKSLFEEDKK
ncbi:MAG: hypothetical protein HDS84_01275 [Bacteroidales bacterium]|nr:hypothetical protein [Bacteroidales bacterium]